ncbi:MAG: PAS domain S-box protein, partial [Gammaproteobacteria bacterium]|nr:PAS domain S-box protein [Gammaproteobacteria bacterium]
MAESSQLQDSTGAELVRPGVEQILESAAEGIYGLDRAGRVTFVNAAAERLTGWPRSEQLGRDAHELIHHSRADGSPYPHRDCPIHATLRDGKTRQRSDERFWRRDGSSFPVSLTCAPLNGPDGETGGVVVTFSDISVQREEQRYRSLIAASSDFVWRCDAEGQLLWISEAWLELTGFTGSQARGLGWLPAVHEEDRDAYLRNWERAIQHGDLFEYEYRLHCRDGSTRWLFDRAVPVRDPDGRILEWIGAGQDITERREAEAEMRRQRERYRTLVESTCAILWEGLPDSFQLTFVSAEAEALLGYPIERWTEEADFWERHVHPDDRERVVEHCRRARAELRPHEIDYRVLAADGRTVWVRDFVTVLAREGRPTKLVGVMVDITAGKETEEALEYVSGLQRHLVEIAGRLVAAGRHELDAAITEALRRLGQYCRVDRSYLLRFGPGFETLSATHVWNAPGIDPLEIRERPRAVTPEEMRRMERRELVHVPRVSDLGDEWIAEREVLEAQGVQSMILVPVVAGDAVEGYVGFDAVRRECTWHDEEIRLLRGLAEIIGATVQRNRAERARRQSESLLKIAGRAARVGGWTVDLQSRRATWSEGVCAIHGVPPGTAPTVEEALARYAPEWRERIRNAFEACAQDGRPYDEEAEIVTERGNRLWVREIGEAVRDAADRITQVRGALQDISEQRQARQDVQRLADRLRTTLESITDAFLTLDRDWRYTYINHEAERVMGRDRGELLGRELWSEYPDVIGTRLEHEYRRAMESNHSVTFEFHYPRFGGWFELHAYPSEEGLAVYFRDINERKQAQQEIEFLALYDPLTRLPNRRLLLDRLQHALVTSGRGRDHGAVLFLDLDHFKTLNDTLGHDVGDSLLQAVAGRLTECLRDGDTVARFGGD